MNQFTSTPYDWIRQIPKEQKLEDEIPLWGNPPLFPWEQFSKELENLFQLKSLSIQPGEVRWREPSELFEGLGADPESITFKISPLQGSAIWLLPKEELKRLMKLFLGQEETSFVEPAFISGFYKFLALEAANVFQKIDFDHSLTPSMVQEEKLPDQRCLSIEIQFVALDHPFQGRLLIDKELRKSIKEYYSKADTYFSTAVNQNIELTLQLLAGSTNLTKEEFRSSQIGDVILLDSCSLFAGEDKGRIMIALNSMPLFRGKIKDGNIKILEYPLFHKEQIDMNQDDEDETEEESTEESEFDSDFEEESDEHLTESEEFTEESELETEPSLDYEESEAESMEEGEEEEKKPAKVTPSAPPPKTEVKAPQEKETKKVALEKTIGKNPLVKLEEIPVTISVEVGRVQMTVQKLLELTPGNLLELDVHPENGVDLVVNGKCVAKGELLQIGEALGVRILDKI